MQTRVVEVAPEWGGIPRIRAREPKGLRLPKA